MKNERKPHFTDIISRRSFIKKGTVLGASSILAGSHLGGLMSRLAVAANVPDIASVQGTDAYTNTIRAVDAIGGMKRFVSKQSNVALLINSDQSNPGAFVKPEIVLAVTRMCLDAGAGQIGVFKRTGSSYWRRTTLNVFHVRQGMTGMVDGCRVFVFQYATAAQSNAAFEQAIGHFKEGNRFTNQARKDTLYAMSGRDKESIVIQAVSPFIVVAISPDDGSKKDRAADVSGRLVLKLSDRSGE